MSHPVGDVDSGEMLSMVESVNNGEAMHVWRQERYGKLPGGGNMGAGCWMPKILGRGKAQ